MTRSEPFPDADARAEPSWLMARRGADVRARQNAMTLVSRLAHHLTPGPAHGIDIGTGTGANRTYLAPRIPVVTRWSVLDHDPDLLDHPAHADAVRKLASITQIAELIDTEGRDRIFLTCSAVLDVLRDRDLEALTEMIVGDRLPALFSLSVTGDVAVHPGDPLDQAITEAFNAHQRRDGRLGPEAPRSLAGLVPSGWLWQVRTPWRLGATTEPGLLRRYLIERAGVAMGQHQHLAEATHRWLERRLRQIDDGHLTVEVGHVDQLVLPT